MKFSKLIFTFISFLIISNYSLAVSPACPGGAPVSLDYSVSGVDFAGGESCDPVRVPSQFVPPPKPTSNTSGTWLIPVPNVPAGPYNFTLTCGGAGAISSADTLNVSDANSELCCGTGPSAGKVWGGAACVAQVWTDYCTMWNDPNGNVNKVWQMDNASTPNYRAKAPAQACCSATGVMAACLPVGAAPTLSVSRSPWGGVVGAVGTAYGRSLFTKAR